MSIFEDINHLLKYKDLVNRGYNVIENVPFEIVEEDNTFDLSILKTKEHNENN